MNREAAIKVANAVLYEGYMLYPYRHSAIKNRQRWTFGILYPPQYHEVGSGTERCIMHSECLLQLRGGSKLEIQLRFLHLLSREIARGVDGDRQSEPLLIDGQVIESRDEGVERSVGVEVQIHENSPAEFLFSFPQPPKTESVVGDKNQPGTITRTEQEITGSISLRWEAVRADLFKLSIDVTNTSNLPAEACDRNAALLRSMISAHLILAASGADFVSLLNPPDEMREEADACRNVGNFPVLVGELEKKERDMLLCSPIILYDYPQVAPESAGDFFDATEMDEMLTLRVMTLTESEKNEVRLAGDRVRQLLDRTEQSAREQLARTHGTIRHLRPVSEEP